jgi:hypothetical protein
MIPLPFAGATSPPLASKVDKAVQRGKRLDGERANSATAGTMMTVLTVRAAPIWFCPRCELPEASSAAVLLAPEPPSEEVAAGGGDGTRTTAMTAT